MIVFSCACGKKLQAARENAGGAVRCPGCLKTLTVPAWEEGIAAAPRPGAVRSSQPAPVRDDRWDDERTGRGDRRERKPEGTLGGLALVAFILGLVAVLVGLALGFVVPMWGLAIVGALAAVAAVLAILAFGQIRRGQGQVTGFGLALAGLIAAIVAVPLYFPGYFVSSTSVEGVGRMTRVQLAAARAQESNNLKQIGLAIHNHAAAQGGRLPDPGNLDPKGRPLLSWRVHLLPHLEQDHLYRQFRLDEPWDSPHNLKLLPAMPAIYAPVRKPSPPGETPYQMFVGPGTLCPEWPPRIPGQKGMRYRIGNIPDGTSNTLCVVDSAKTVPWTKPEDIAYDPNGPLPALGWTTQNQILALYWDGSVRGFDRARLRDQTLRFLIEPADGNVIPFDEVD